MLKYKEKTKEVEAIKLLKEIAVNTGDKSFVGSPGDMMVFDNEGNVEIMNEEDFNKRYELATTVTITTPFMHFNSNTTPCCDGTLRYRECSGHQQ